MSDPYRVLVAVSPLMLSDLIRMTLVRSPGYDVTVVREDELAGATGHFDVVVTTRPVPRSLRAELVIVLPGPDAGTAPAEVIDLTGESLVEIPSVDAMLDLIELRR